MKLRRREVLAVVDSATLANYRQAAAQCVRLVQIEVRATEGQLYTDANGNFQSVPLDCTLVSIVHPTNDLGEFWQKVSNVVRESLEE